VLLPQDIDLDDGYSGGTLVRPALERLRDRVSDGTIDRLYVHSPDRLARKYAYQVLLLDDLRKHGVITVFLNAPAGKTAEDELLVQVQGMIAEYERAKVLERSRRGKIHRARQGEVGPIGTAPYGFAYVKKRDGAAASYHRAPVRTPAHHVDLAPPAHHLEVVRQAPKPAWRDQTDQPAADPAISIAGHSLRSPEVLNTRFHRPRR
jgi:hypothetical protein